MPETIAMGGSRAGRSQAELQAAAPRKQERQGSQGNCSQTKTKEEMRQSRAFWPWGRKMRGKAWGHQTPGRWTRWPRSLAGTGDHSRRLRQLSTDANPLVRF